MKSWGIISHHRVGTKYLLPIFKHTLNMVVLGGWAVGDFCSLLLSWQEMDINTHSFDGNDRGSGSSVLAVAPAWLKHTSGGSRIQKAELSGRTRQSAQPACAGEKSHGGSRRRWPAPFSPLVPQGRGSCMGGWRAAERKQDGRPSPAPISCAFVVFPPRPRDTSLGALPGSNRDTAVTGGRDKLLLQR